MALIGELLQRVQSLYSKGVESDDSRLTRRHIYSKLLSSKGRLMFQKFNKKQFISRWNFDYLPCVEMKLVEGHECPCVPPVGCEILRSVHKLPKPMSSISKHIIDSVTSIEGSVVFYETTFKAKKWRNGDKYTSKRPDYFIHNGYLYITVTRKLKAVSVSLLANDPLDILDFPSMCDEVDTDCNTSIMDVEFNIDEDLIDTLIEMASQELIGVFNQSREDLSNDSKDSSQQESK